MAARNHGLTDRMLDDAVCESAGAVLLGAAGAAHARRVDPRTLFDRARIGIDPLAPSGCRGMSRAGRDEAVAGGAGEAPEVVRIALGGPVEEILATMAHEGGHLVVRSFLRAQREGSGVHSRQELLRDRGARRNHGEGDATRAAQAFCYPREAVRAVLRQRGLDVREVVAICPTMPVPWAILRLAWVAERGVVISPPGARAPIVWMPEGITLPPWEVWAACARRLSRAARVPQGVDALNYVDERGATWSVSVLPAAHEDASWRFLAESAGVTGVEK